MEARASSKGQIVIPAPLRRKYGIRKGTRIRISEEHGEIVLRPITLRSVERALDRLQGSLKGSGMLQELMDERRRDREKEDAGWTPPRV